LINKLNSDYFSFVQSFVKVLSQYYGQKAQAYTGYRQKRLKYPRRHAISVHIATEQATVNTSPD